MTSPSQFREMIIRPTLEGLGLWSLAAERLLLGTALTESGLVYLTQHGGGPARGFYQVEPATMADLYGNWLKFRPAWQGELDAFLVPGYPLAEQLVWNLRFATGVARLHYFRRPESLPADDDVEGLARYWKKHFNTRAGDGRWTDFVKKAGREIMMTD